ncbi:molybdenum cofactor biosynthesis protein MoaE [Rhabdochromatium marinum]|nr:molybdenum cofactor biosynthesis protein MoaE [Rhabdochromatium marinum]
MFETRIQSHPFDPEHELRQLRQTQSHLGALVSFTGIMRDWSGGESVSEMVLEHYPGMTEAVLARLLDRARERWSLCAALVVHRTGRLLPEEPIVLVAVGSLHRTEAFRACEFLIDALKTEAPLWKRETTASGTRWVSARQQDVKAAARWTSAGDP